jgi:CheY-like chemotaxis protein
LLVEDDELARPAARIMLEQILGYRVLSVADGNAAMALLETDAGIDLMFSDIMMPGINDRKFTQPDYFFAPRAIDNISNSTFLSITKRAAP